MVFAAAASAASWLSRSNVVYIAGSVLTLAAALHVVFEKRAVAGKPSVTYFLSDLSVIMAAIISLVGTVGAIYFGNLTGKLKDAELETYKLKAGVQIAQLQKDAGDANAAAAIAIHNAAEANERAEDARLSIETARKEAKEAESNLAVQNAQTEQFTKALAHQQEGIAKRVHSSPDLTSAQIGALSQALMPFTGTAVVMVRTEDAVSGRLADEIGQAIEAAHLGGRGAAIAFGATYQGVSIAVRTNKGHPPLADVLADFLTKAGVPVHKVAMTNIPEGAVFIYLGPE